MLGLMQHKLCCFDHKGRAHITKMKSMVFSPKQGGGYPILLGCEIPKVRNRKGTECGLVGVQRAVSCIRHQNLAMQKVFD